MAKEDIGVVGMTVGIGGTNCYFVYRDDKKDHTAEDPVPGVIFDPGDRGGVIYDRLLEKGLKVSLIVLTHGHYDHILGVAEMREKSGAEVWYLSAEKEMMEDPDFNMSSEIDRPTTVSADRLLEEGDTINEAGLTFKVMATPGHSPGGACFYCEEGGFVIAGDTLFQGSIGRTDFRGGDMDTLLDSIRTKLFTLPDDTEVLPGHMGTSSIGFEKKYNPFLS